MFWEARAAEDRAAYVIANEIYDSILALLRPTHALDAHRLSIATLIGKARVQLGLGDQRAALSTYNDIERRLRAVTPIVRQYAYASLSHLRNLIDPAPAALRIQLNNPDANDDIVVLSSTTFPLGETITSPSTDAIIPTLSVRGALTRFFYHRFRDSLWVTSPIIVITALTYAIDRHFLYAWYPIYILVGLTAGLALFAMSTRFK
jgi:hypothetical protein